MNKKLGMLLLQVIMTALGLLVIFPLLFVAINSVKSLQEVTLNMLSLPVKIHWENFSEAIRRMNFGVSFRNTLFITVLSLIGVLLFSSMTAYQIVRKKCLASKLIFLGLLLSMTIPFQVLMVPVVIVANHLRIVNSQMGLVIMYWGFLLPMAVFLYQGFVKSIPIEIEEAAFTDGCNQYQVFFGIVFPVMKPMTVTVAVLNLLAVYNDFTLPLIMLSSKERKTIPLALSNFFGSYLSEWQLIMAAIVVTIAPMLIIYLILQKQVMAGYTEGAIKG